MQKLSNNDIAEEARSRLGSLGELSPRVIVEAIGGNLIVVDLAWPDDDDDQGSRVKAMFLADCSVADKNPSLRLDSLFLIAEAWVGRQREQKALIILRLEVEARRQTIQSFPLLRDGRGPGVDLGPTKGEREVKSPLLLAFLDGFNQWQQQSK
jgi:hypothetical protein